MGIRASPFWTVAALALMITGVAWSLLPSDPVPSTLAQTGVFDRGALDLRINGEDDIGGFLRAENLIPGGSSLEGTLVLTAGGSVAKERVDLDVAVAYTAEETDWPEATVGALDMGHYLEVTKLRYGDRDLLRDPEQGLLATVDAHPAFGDGDGKLSLAELTVGLNDLTVPGPESAGTPFTLGLRLMTAAPNSVMGDIVRLRFTFMLAERELEDLNLLGEGPVTSVEVFPKDAVVEAGSVTRFVAVPRNADGEVVGKVAPTFGVRDAPMGTVSHTGFFLAMRAGETGISGSVGDVVTWVPVTVVPGPLAEIRVIPSHATVPAGESLRFHAEGLDAFGNARSHGEDTFTWHSEAAERGTIDPNGLFKAGNASSVVRLTARSDEVFRQFVVTIVGGKAPKDTVTQMQATSARTITGTTTALAQVVGLAEAEEGARLNVTGEKWSKDDRNRGGVTHADIAIGAKAKNLAVVLEVQPGNLTTTPPEVDRTSLEGKMKELPSSPKEPGLFLNVRATEDGAPVTSQRLNQILQRVNVTFQADEAYLREHRLDPMAPRILEYSEGRLVRDDLVAELVTVEDGVYTYRLELDQFSSFAIVWRELPPPVVGGGGGGGPAPTLTRVVQGPAEVTLTPEVVQGTDGPRASARIETRGDTLLRIPLDHADPALGVLTLRIPAPVSGSRVEAGVVRQDALLKPQGVGLDEPLLLIDLGFDGIATDITSRELRFALTPKDLAGTEPSKVRLLQRIDGAWLRLPFTTSAEEGGALVFHAKLPVLAPVLVVAEGELPVYPAPIATTGPPRVLPLMPAPDSWGTDLRPLVFAQFPGGDVEPASVVLRLNGKVVAGGAASRTGVLLVPPTDLLPGQNFVEVSVRSPSGAPSIVSWTFGVDTEPPLVVDVPLSRVLPVEAGARTLRFFLHDAVSGVDPDRVSVRVAGRAMAAHIEDGVLVVALPDGLRAGEHEVRLLLRDRAGNEVEESFLVQAASGTGPTSLLPILLLLSGAALALLFLLRRGGGSHGGDGDATRTGSGLSGAAASVSSMLERIRGRAP